MSNLWGQRGENPLQRQDEPGRALTRSTDWPSSGPKDAAANFGRLREALRRRLWLIAAGFVPVFALAVIYSALAPREYESESTFLIEDSGRGAAGSPLELLDRLGRVGRIENEVELLKSRRVVAPTVDALDLHVTAKVEGRDRRPRDLLGEFDATRSTVEGSYLVATSPDSVTKVFDVSTGDPLSEGKAGDTIHVAGISFVAPAFPSPEIVLTATDFERGVNSALDQVAASRIGREADLIRLSCTASDPGLARDICLDISKSYLELRGDLQLTEATNAQEFLSDATEQIRERLTGAEDSLAGYARRHGAVALETRAEEEVRSLAQIRAQRELLEADRSALASYLAGVKAGSAGTFRYRELANFPTFLRNEAVTELVASLIELDNRRSDLSVLRSAENPELAAINGRIEEIELQLLNLASSYEAALETQVRAYDVVLQRGSNRLAILPRQQIEYLRRERKVQQLRQVHDMLEGQLREAELAAGVSLPGVRPIDAPQLPLKPSAPSVGLNLVLGAFLGLGFGIFLAIVRELTDVRLRNREQVEVAAGAPVIGMIPALRKGVALMQMPPEGKNAASGRWISARTVLRAGAVDPEWEPAVEAFRTLVADLKLAGAGRNGGAGCRSLAVTSSAQGEGKTFTACNLALVWASTGSRTLLVDADLRAGSVARFFKMQPDLLGFGDVLKGTAGPADAFQTVRVKGGNSLHILTAGQPGTYDAVNALHLPGRVADAFERLEKEFDLVVVDTTPLNIVSDSTIIAAAADAVLFVVRSGITRPEALDHALQRLRRVNRELVGLVLNDIKLPGYYSTYYSDDRQS